MITNNVSVVNCSNRLDRLPISKVHRTVLFALAFVYFFDYSDLNTFAYAAPALIKSWDISVQTIALITSMSFLGMFLGSFMGGRLADRIGRKKAMIYMVILFSLFSLLNAIAWNPLSLGIFRFFTGMGVAAVTVIAGTYITEFFPSAKRGRYQALCVTFGLIGIPITSWVSRLLIPTGPEGWRFVFVWGALGILSLFFIRKIEESPRWYEICGEFDKAEVALKKIESSVIQEKGSLSSPAISKDTRIVAAAPFTSLFKGKCMKRTLLLIGVWILQTFGFYGFGSWAPTLLVKNGMDIEKTLTIATLFAIGAPLGAFIGSLVSDRFERKWTITITSVIVAISGLLYGLTFNPIFIVTFGFLLNLIERVFSSNLYAYTSELYPTELRASGTGLTYGVGRLSNMVGPMLISFIFTGYGYFSVFVFISLCWLAVAITVGIFGPFTKDKGLEDLNIDDTEKSSAVEIDLKVRL
ncbi:MFS transporter [Priestia megaterium]|uniref:MFS transporter n=1 Tax=Priestia megaterium TaxID=1404 RepID=UPI00272F16F8|nr:MFS transporter [Priestia megaterium]MDP1442922.1 MFS transporter [Priestia megaterium]MDP1472023.1 MFS transporter [Priestia megaterium]